MDTDEQDTLRKKKRSTAKGKFHRIYRRFNDSIDEDEEPSVLKEILKDLETAYAELEKRHDDYIEHLSEDERIAELNNDMDAMYKELCSAKSSLAKFTERQKKQKTAVLQRDAVNNIRVKKLDAPSFSGGVRSYPSFKRDFETHMTTVFGKDPFVLKRCLTDEALLTIAGVDDDYDEMFRRLDMKYGRPEKLTDAVLIEIKKLRKISDGDYNKFIEMVDVIERCWLDLKRMKLETEMNTTTMISQIEKLLPSVQKREWALRKQKSDSKKLNHCFSEFLDFLLEEKYAMEYMEANLRESPGAPSKHKIHSTFANVEANYDANECDGIIDSLKCQMQGNQQMLQQVVEGLAHVAQVVANSKDIKHPTFHNTRKKCWYHGTDSHDIGSCVSFAQLDNQNKMSLLKKNGGCFSCLRTGHISNKCVNKKPCEIMNELQQRCGRMHHPSLHAAQAEGMSFHNAIRMINDKKQSDAVLLMLSQILCKGIPVTTLWDPGANMTLITHRMARKMGLKGKAVTLSVTKVGNVTELINSKEYIVPLTDLHGNTWQVRAYGMAEVTAEVGSIDVSHVIKLFRGITESDIKRPTGNVDLLVGTDCCTILPNKVQQVGNLQLMKNQFGYCLRGNHESLAVSGDVCHNIIQIHFISGQIKDINETRILPSKQINELLQSFFDIETLGTHCVPKCGSCKCGKCPVGSKNYTIQEERELVTIQQGLQYNANRKKWVAKYPWKRDAKCLPNNFIAAKARLMSTEKRLRKSGSDYSKAYHEQIVDMLRRHVARKLSAHEIDSYQGPVHYIPHHEVLKSESKSTPIRIVFNSSASFMGHVLNDYWAKGPNILNDMLAILIRFRQDYIGFAGDISKMYNSVEISSMDQHTHRFLWRDLESDRDPDHYVLQTVTFGDKPSGSIATLALRKTAQMGRLLYPDAAEMIERNSYVDDFLHSVDSLSKAEQLASETEAILHEGGFAVKHWIISKTDGKTTDMNLTILDTEEERILGMYWVPKADVFKFKVKVNFSAKRQKVYEKGNLNRETLHSGVPLQLTRRMVLSQVASIFDPLGLITPFVLSAKELMRNMCISDKAKGQFNSENNTWDSVMSNDFRQFFLQPF